MMDTIEQENKMNVLVVEPGKRPYVKAIGRDLRSLQQEVGGYIEAIYPFKDHVAIICDEEGKLTGKSLNRALYDDRGEVSDIIAGPFLVAGLSAEDFDSLSDDLIRKYAKRFHDPETFVQIGRGIIAIPIEPDEPKAEKGEDTRAKKQPIDTQIQSAQERASDPQTAPGGMAKETDLEH